MEDKSVALQLKVVLNSAIEDYEFSTRYVGIHHGKYLTVGLFKSFLRSTLSCAYPV